MVSKNWQHGPGHHNCFLTAHGQVPATQAAVAATIWKRLHRISSQYMQGHNYLCKLHSGITVPGRGVSASHQ